MNVSRFFLCQEISYICYMKTTIEINSLKLHAHHGVFRQENTVGNAFEVTLSIDIDIPAEVYIEDSLNGTINYAHIIDIVKREMAIPSSLLENVAYRIKKALMEAYPQIMSGAIRIAKLLPPISNTELESVAVRISW